ncbi:transmembrane phosphatase with tensin homology [Mus musculus]|uniref:Transmembrane phosphatase with tensin homology n=1 Tax=Mus musculus TaxID=10090 RepID=G5E8H5_MOUSE|nr:transmembrane phosphatase with tensin homology [Mus musculus]EDL32898.1 mCG118205, isoform CRA_c [Mus musculus]|eukprot:NP_954866.2 transmembrane phosphatase with tensin homology [Mus musculus]
MYGEKKSHLYLWMEHYGYDMPANIYKMYSQPSRKTDDANKKVSVSASRTIKLNGSTGYDTNEQITLITNGSSLSYPDEIKSASYADPISTKAYTNDSSVYDPGGASSSTTLYELNSLSEVSKEIITQGESALLRDKEATSELKIPSTLQTQTSMSTNTLSLSDLSSDYQEEQMNKCKLNQMSKLYDDDERTDIQKSYWNVVKKFVRILVSSVAFRIFGIFLVILDVFLVVVDLNVSEKKIYIPLDYRSISLAIALFFLVDVLLRVSVEGRRRYFSDVLNTLDAVVIGVTVVVAVIYALYDKHFLRDIPRLAVLLRPLRLLILIRILQLAHQKRQLERLTRKLVSGNKRRYKKDGFDLDLTYVTERIIAMSFPSSGRESFYRNPIKEVVRFLDTKHPNHYQVYNLCSERAYDPKHFHYRVRRIMIDDHNVPTLEEMLLFSKEVNNWMAQDPENVVAIHCKGGKGRTGTMVCACLIASEIVLNAKESLYFFGERRTDKSNSSKFQGIETPSQNRYVKYFEKLKINYQLTLPPKKVLVIKRLVVYSIHGVGKGDGSDLEVQIIMWQETVFSFCNSRNCMIFHDPETDRAIINVFHCPALYDDVKVKFLSPNLPKYYDDCPFFFWFHTSFIKNNRLYLPRNELDNTHKPKTWKIYGEKFAVEVDFGEN